jgi:anti-anti-sigma factor
VNLAEVVEFDFDPGDGITATARLGGDLDLVSVQAIGYELIGYAAAGSLIVDITDVDFLDSSGLKLLVDCAKAARGRSHAVRTAWFSWGRPG